MRGATWGPLEKGVLGSEVCVFSDSICLKRLFSRQQASFFAFPSQERVSVFVFFFFPRLMLL